MTVFSAIVSALAFFACVAFMGLAAYVWFRRRTYTRERFAFYALASCVTVTFGVFGTIAGNAPPWQQVLIVIHYIREGEILNPALSPILSAFLVLSLFGMYGFAYLLFRGWDGQTSQETFQAMRAGKEKTEHSHKRRLLS